MNFGGKSPMSELRRKTTGRSRGGLLFSASAMKTGAVAGGCARKRTLTLTGSTACTAAITAPPLYKIAAGPRGDDYHWTEVLMREAVYFMDGLALH